MEHDTCDVCYVCYRVFNARCFVGLVAKIYTTSAGRNVLFFSFTVVGSLKVFLELVLPRRSIFHC